MSTIELWHPQPGQHFTEISSTNDWLKKQAPEVGQWVRADAQTQGRGRSDHDWHSPSGNLYMSVCLPRVEPLILISLAVANAAVEFCRDEGAEVGLKWPNDLLRGKQKCGGILAEILEKVVVVGVGLNLSNQNLFEGASFLDFKNKNLVELAEKFVNYLPKWTSRGVAAELIQENWLANRGQRLGCFSYQGRSLKGHIRKLDLAANQLLVESDGEFIAIPATQLQEFLA